MGQSTSSLKDDSKLNEVNKYRFEFQYIIGKGGFGRVWRVIDKKSQKLFALKEMSKVKIIDKKSEKSIQNERHLLSKLKSHPFIVNLHYAFQDSDNLYLVIDLLTGGDLRFHICKQNTFNEEQTKFILSNIIISLEYIHSKGVVHRDIKPENLIMDERGYIRLTDFGISKEVNENSFMSTSGTPGYMAPEVMKGQRHSKEVDFFALGVVGYELMLGRRPYKGKTRKEVKEEMMSKQAEIKRSDIPHGWSWGAVDFINELLKRKPERRLGYQGVKEVKNHYWIKMFKWKEVLNKRLVAPYIPKEGDNFDKKYCNYQDKVGFDTLLRYDNYKSDIKYKEMFANYTYYYKGQLSLKKMQLNKRCQSINSAYYKTVIDEKFKGKENPKSNTHLIKKTKKLTSSISVNEHQNNEGGKASSKYIYPYKGLALTSCIKSIVNFKPASQNYSVGSGNSNSKRRYSNGKELFSLSKVLNNIRASSHQREKRKYSKKENERVMLSETYKRHLIKKYPQTPKGKIIAFEFQKEKSFFQRNMHLSNGGKTLQQ